MMRADVSAVRELLRGHDPAFVDAGPRPGPSADLERILERARAEATGGSPPGAAVRRRSPRRRLVLTLGAGATALGVVLGTGVIGAQASIDPAAAAAARDAARVARAGTDSGAFGPGKVWYVRSLQRAQGQVVGADGRVDYTYFAVRSMESWVAADGKKVLRYRLVGDPTSPSARDRAAFAADTDGVDKVERANDIDDESDDELQTYRDLVTLPTDPDLLFAHLKAKARSTTNDTDREMFTLATDALKEPVPLPPAVRAAL